MKKSLLLQLLDHLGRVYVEGVPQHLAEFYGINLTRLRWIMYALGPLWLLALLAHNNSPVLDGFLPAASHVADDPLPVAHLFASLPTVTGIVLSLAYLLLLRGRLTSRGARGWGAAAGIGLIFTEGGQFGFAHGHLAHMTSFSVAMLLAFSLIPARFRGQAGLLAFSMLLPLAISYSTGMGLDRIAEFLMSLTMPFGAAVLGLILYYAQYRSFRLRKLAEMRLRRRTAEAERGRVALEQQWEMERNRITWLENMASFLRHELRNALVGAKVSVQLMAKRNEVPDDDPYRARTERALKIIMELLDNASAATSIESAILQESTDRLDLKQFMDEQAAVYKSLYPHQPVTVSCGFSGVYVRAREERLTQMLDKLVSNAVEYSTAGYEVEIICADEGKGRVSITVRNHGAPLPENRDSLFDLFASYRAADVETGRRGIGLYVVRLIAERYGGRVHANNRRDAQGAEFVVELPTVV